MSGIAVAVTALWLGIMTSISPCPLAGNIAAISYIGGKSESFRRSLYYGVSYTLGRAVTYLVIASLVVTGLLGIPGLSMFLQTHLNRILGPVLLLSGMFLLELISINLPGNQVSDSLAKRLGNAGLWGAFLLGLLLALAFCPVSAAFFFGSLIPLSVKSGSMIVLPALYGFGTALPVILFAVLIAAGKQSIGAIFNSIRSIELWARRITGLLLILIGIYMILRYIFGVL